MGLFDRRTEDDDDSVTPQTGPQGTLVGQPAVYATARASAVPEEPKKEPKEQQAAARPRPRAASSAAPSGRASPIMATSPTTSGRC